MTEGQLLQAAINRVYGDTGGQTQLAAEMGYSRRQVCRWVDDKSPIPQAVWDHLKGAIKKRIKLLAKEIRNVKGK